MKRVIQHTRNCPRKRTGLLGPCSVCKEVRDVNSYFKLFVVHFKFIALCCYHARRCHEIGCRIPYCKLIKTRLEQQRQLARRRQDGSDVQDQNHENINRPISPSYNNSNQNASGPSLSFDAEQLRHNTSIQPETENTEKGPMETISWRTTVSDELREQHGRFSYNL